MDIYYKLTLKVAIYWGSYRLYKTTCHLIASTKRPKNGVHGICFDVQSGVDLCAPEKGLFISISLYSKAEEQRRFELCSILI